MTNHQGNEIMIIHGIINRLVPYSQWQVNYVAGEENLIQTSMENGMKEVSTIAIEMVFPTAD